MSRHAAPRLPPHAPGMAIGLYGGSFDPPHAAHRMVAELALRRLGLDRVWVLVTPGNPIKTRGGLPPLGDRLAAAKALMAHPRIVVTGLEADLGTSRTSEVLAYLKARAPGVRFVWIMGADNLEQLHRWSRWRRIAEAAPIAVVDRPGSSSAPLSARAAQVFAGARIDERDATGLSRAAPPAWAFLHGRRSDLSSTALRRRG